MNDRFKFRVWDNLTEKYIPRNQCILLSDGTLIQEIAGESIILEDAVVEFSTGLKDKNGNRIYEGDIGKHPSGQIFIVKWNVDRWIAYYPETDDWSSLILQLGNKGQAAIIGNIHKNGDLLK